MTDLNAKHNKVSLKIIRTKYSGQNVAALQLSHAHWVLLGGVIFVYIPHQLVYGGKGICIHNFFFLFKLLLSQISSDKDSLQRRILIPELGENGCIASSRVSRLSAWTDCFTRIKYKA